MSASTIKQKVLLTLFDSREKSFREIQIQGDALPLCKKRFLRTSGGYYPWAFRDTFSASIRKFIAEGSVIVIKRKNGIFYTKKKGPNL